MAKKPLDLDEMLAGSDDFLDQFPYDGVVVSADTKPGKTNDELGRHIALFVAWLVHRGLASQKLEAQRKTLLSAFRAGQISARQLLRDAFDDQLLPETMSERANRFARAYYRTGGDHHYFEDLEALYPNLQYFDEIPDAPDAEQRVFTLLDRRLAELAAP
jgi:hypothetical protein